MKDLIFPVSLVFLCSLLLSGCDLAQPHNKRQGDPPVAQNGPLPEEVVPEQEAPVQGEAEAVAVRAEPGLTGRGNYTSAAGNNPMGIITVPISAYFRAQDRLVLQQIDHAVNLYRAEHGRGPTTHDEFMDKIIQVNNIQLPRLPTGQTYEYDPADGQLKVRRPRDTP